MRVAILGGGVGGLCAAHELIERGFEVEVFERRHILGGKARSMLLPVPQPDGQVVEQPGEHGFRFFHSGYYLHLYDTMRRIPLPNGSGHSVYDNLVDVPVQYNSGEMYGADSRAEVPGWLLKLMTTGNERALREYEDLPFSDFVDGARYSERIDDDQSVHVAKETPKVLQAVNSRDCSTRAMCLLATRLGDPRERPAKILNAPTSTAWFDPWRAYLESLGVQFHTDVCVTALHCEDGQIVAVHTNRGDLTADYYVAALPVEVMRRLLNPELLAADPHLAGLERLKTDWMVGFQLFLAERLAELPPGHWGFGNTPFKISGIQQTDFWPNAVRDVQLSGPCRAIVSVIVSDVDTPGILFGKPARFCTESEIEQELWAQMDMGARGTPFETAFKRAGYLGFAVNPDVILTGDDQAYNESPLFVNHCGALWHRPTARTAVPNLFLAADYVRTNTDICTMESAGEAARHAVNGILEAAGFTGAPCRIFSLEEMSADTPLLSQIRAFDDLLAQRGQPHVLDQLDRNLAGRLVESAQIFKGFQLYRPDSKLGEFTHVIAEVVTQLCYKLSQVPNLVPQVPGLADLARLVSTGRERQTSTVERLGLRHSVREWAGVDMQLVSALTGRAPASMHSYLDTQNPIYAPLLYTCELDGSQHRVGFVRALSSWLQVPAETVSHIIELGQCLHACSLVIDDVLDETETRRGALAAWAKFSQAEALGAGYAAVFQVLLSTGLYLGDDGLAIVVEEIARAHHSNAMEIYFRETRTCPDEEEYLAIVDGKTGCAFRMIARLLIAHADVVPSPRTADAIKELATAVGRFFQIRDDYLDLTSKTYADKKGTRCSDFAEGKFSYPVMRCLNARPELLPQFVEVFDKPHPSVGDITRLLSLLANGLDETLVTLDTLRCEMLELTDQIGRTVSLGTAPTAMRDWIETLCRDIPTLARNEPQQRRARKAVDLTLTSISMGACRRAVRSVLAFYDGHCCYQGRSVRDFWSCFPVLLATELYMVAVDDLNEIATDGAECLHPRRPIMRLLSHTGWDTTILETLLEQASRYYRLERRWLKGESLDLKTWRFMSRAKATDFQVMEWLCRQLLGPSDTRPDPALTVFERIVMLRIDAREREFDRHHQHYNLIEHVSRIQGDASGDVHLVTELEALVSTLPPALAARADAVVARMDKPIAEDDDEHLPFDLYHVLAAGDRVATACLEDSELSDFSLSRSWQWIAGELRPNRQTPLRTLSARALKGLRASAMP